MHFSTSTLVFLGVTLEASYASAQLATVPKKASDPSARAAAITTTRAGFVYGPSKLGNTSFFPTGTIGDKMVSDGLALLAPQAAAVYDEAQIDMALVNKTIEDVSSNSPDRPC